MSEGYWPPSATNEVVDQNRKLSTPTNLPDVRMQATINAYKKQGKWNQIVEMVEFDKKQNRELKKRL